MFKAQSILGLLVIALTVQANASVSDFMTCENKDYKITVGVDTAFEKMNQLHVLVAAPAGESSDYELSVTKASDVKIAVQRGVVLDNLEGQDDTMLLVINNAYAKVAFDGHIENMRCKSIQ